MPLVKVKNRHLLNIQRGLKALDSITDGTKTHRFEYSTATRWKIVKNLVVVDRAVEIYSACEVKLMTAAGFVGGEQMTEENKAKFISFQHAKTELGNLESEIEVSLFTQGELEEKNQKVTIPLSALTDIWDLLVPEAEEGDVE